MSHDTIASLQRLADISLDPHNANAGTPRGREAVSHSLTEFGAARSVVTDRNGVVIAGNKTVAEAQRLALPIDVIRSTGDRLVVVQRTDLDLADGDRARRLALADNRASEVGLEWDADELKALADDGLDLHEFWSDRELEELVGRDESMDGADREFVPRDTTIAVGDLFVLGAHRLICGDATSASTVARVLDGATPVLMPTDPPYGVAYDPAWRARVKRNGRTAAGRVANDDRVDWSAAFALFPGDVAYVWHAGLHAGPVGDSLVSCGFALRAQIIWVKSHFAMSRGAYHWMHEPCWYAVRKGANAHWCGDRTQTTVWHEPNLNPFGGGVPEGENRVTGHGTQKPVHLFEIPILNHTRPGEAIYEPFAGSGSALIAAQKTQRRCLAIELDPRYVQAIIDRWEVFTGQRAERVDGGACE